MNKKIYLVRSHTWGLIVLLFLSCQMKTYTLQNGKTKVPKKSSVYANKSKFEVSLLSIIDTTVVYEEFDIDKKILLRYDNDITTKFYGIYRFYSDGYFNLFIINREDVLDTNSFNPEYRGYRGVYYKEDNQIRYDIFTIINELGHIGKLSGTFKISSDTLLVNRDVNKYPRMYIKRVLPSSFLNHQANW